MELKSKIQAIKKFFYKKKHTNDYLEQVLGKEGIKKMYNCWIEYREELQIIEYIRTLNYKKNLAKLSYEKDEIPKLINDLTGMQNDFIEQCYLRIKNPIEQRKREQEEKNKLAKM